MVCSVHASSCAEPGSKASGTDPERTLRSRAGPNQGVPPMPTVGRSGSIVTMMHMTRARPGPAPATGAPPRRRLQRHRRSLAARSRSGALRRAAHVRRRWRRDHRLRRGVGGAAARGAGPTSRPPVRPAAASTGPSSSPWSLIGIGATLVLRADRAVVLRCHRRRRRGRRGRRRARLGLGRRTRTIWDGAAPCASPPGWP